MTRRLLKLRLGLLVENWFAKNSSMADKILSLVIEFDQTAKLNYNKIYVGLKIYARAKSYAII